MRRRTAAELASVIISVLVIAWLVIVVRGFVGSLVYATGIAAGVAVVMAVLVWRRRP